MSSQQGNSKTPITIHMTQEFHHGVFFPYRHTPEINIHFMRQLAQNSTYLYDTYNFNKIHYNKMYNITQNKKKQNFKFQMNYLQ